MVPYDAARVRILGEDGVGLVGNFEGTQVASLHCVVILHGVGSKRQEMLGLRADFRAAGYNVLLPDGRGMGNPAASG